MSSKLNKDLLHQFPFLSEMEKELGNLGLVRVKRISGIEIQTVRNLPKTKDIISNDLREYPSPHVGEGFLVLRSVITLEKSCKVVPPMIQTVVYQYKKEDIKMTKTTEIHKPIWVDNKPEVAKNIIETTDSATETFRNEIEYKKIFVNIYGDKVLIGTLVLHNQGSYPYVISFMPVWDNLNDITSVVRLFRTSIDSEFTEIVVEVTYKNYEEAFYISIDAFLDIEVKQMVNANKFYGYNYSVMTQSDLEYKPTSTLDDSSRLKRLFYYSVEKSNTNIRDPYIPLKGLQAIKNYDPDLYNFTSTKIDLVDCNEKKGIEDYPMIKVAYMSEDKKVIGFEEEIPTEFILALIKGDLYLHIPEELMTEF